MGWFDNPKCPHCGGELQETGYCDPYPAWRCPACIKRNREDKERQEEMDDCQEEMDDLRSRVANLESQLRRDTNDR